MKGSAMRGYFRVILPVVLLPALLLASCGSYSLYKAYSGPALPREKVAILLLPGGAYGYRSVRLDGRPLSDLELVRQGKDVRPLGQYNPFTYIELLAGPHELVVTYDLGFSKYFPGAATVYWYERRQKTVPFSVEPDHAYELVLYKASLMGERLPGYPKVVEVPKTWANRAYWKISTAVYQQKQDSASGKGKQ